MKRGQRPGTEAVASKGWLGAHKWLLVCPKPKDIRPALKCADKGMGPVITSVNCTNCGRCIDVCTRNVFRFGGRFGNRAVKPEQTTTHHSPGAEVLR